MAFQACLENGQGRRQLCGAICFCLTNLFEREPLRVAKVSPTQIGAVHRSCAEVSAVNLNDIPQIRALEVGVAEIGARELSSHHARVLQLTVIQVAPAEIGMVQQREIQARAVPECGPSKNRSGEVVANQPGASQICMAQVNTPKIRMHDR